MIYIGIDPGVHTGIAVWDSDNKQLYIQTLPILQAMAHVQAFTNPVVYVEDARQRKWFGDSGKERAQGAGSIKRDCQIWQEFLTENGIIHYFLAPKNNKTKLTAEQFKRITGYKGTSNQHNRDAAMIVWGK